MSDMPLAEVAYHGIRQKLLNGEYLPGKLLSESELASWLNMSRTPIRAAVSQLEKDGFVETLNKRGILVKPIDNAELYEMFDLLLALYFYTLEQLEEYDYELDLSRMKHYLDEVEQASLEKRDRDYYENGLLFMRTMISALGNRCILETFERYKDKILFYVVAHRSTAGKHRPYTGKKMYAEVYRLLKQQAYQEARGAIREAKRSLRESLIRTGSTLLS